MEHDIMIKNATIVTQDPQRRVLQNGFIYLSEGRIQDIGPSSKNDHKADLEIDGSRKIVLPGLVNNHTHLFQVLCRGKVDDLPVTSWFNQGVAPLASKLSLRQCRIAAYVGCMEAIKSGTTTINDFMYAHPTEGLSDEVVRVFDEVGIRGILSRGIVDGGYDFGIPEAMIEDLSFAIRDTRRVIRVYDNYANGRIHIWIAPASLWMSTLDAFRRAKELAEDTNCWLTFHSQESKSITEYTATKYGNPDLRLLTDLKLLNDRTLAVHCVWYNDTDIEIAKATGIKVAHCPIANMYLADGVAPIPTMLGSGICVGLGTDGPASNNNLDMFGVMKSAVLLQKVHNMNPQALSCQDALDMATIKGAESLGLEKDTGSLEVGKKGDMVILDAYDFNMLPANNPISSLIYCATPGNVQIVIIEGKIVFENGKFPHLDEDRVKEEAGDVVNDVSPSVYGS